MVDARSGALGILAWVQDPQNASRLVLASQIRLLSQPVFDCPLDVEAKRLGSLPVAWSFATRDLPPGMTLAASQDVVRLLTSAPDESFSASEVEQGLIRFLQNGQ
jgi:hypothetical protein